MVDTVAHSVLPAYAEYAAVFTTIVAIPAVIAEGWFGVWLLVKGGKKQDTADGQAL